MPKASSKYCPISVTNSGHFRLCFFKPGAFFDVQCNKNNLGSWKSTLDQRQLPNVNCQIANIACYMAKENGYFFDDNLPGIFIDILLPIRKARKSIFYG